MNQFLNKLEKKYGRYAIPDLIKYIVALYCLGAVLGLVNQNIYYQYLALDMNAVLHGQVWRLVTFLLEPYGFDSSLGIILGVIFFFFQINLFFLFGRSLEQAWGTFRFNLYFLTGYLFNILAAVILYVSPLHATIYDSGLHYIYWSMFFAFAVISPNMELLLYGIIPLKVKWLAIFDAAFMLYDIVKKVYYGFYLLRMGQPYVSSMCFSVAVAIVVAMANFLLFFFASRDYQRIRPKQVHRRREFKRKTQQTGGYPGGARHRCAICGRTELDDDRLDFRYCSKCDGNYEYCSDHLFTHQHVRKQ
ncbi:MAG: hypothetical protein SO170_08340 [Butyribacter sp.]|nr:hypothetical protein [bacterium]MDY3854944.1 hypothetical protein [Butyribacter sp.]